MNLLIDNTVRVSLMMLIGLGARFILRRRSAAMRHWVLAASIVCAGVTPLLGMVVPAWHFIPDSRPADEQPQAVSTIETFAVSMAEAAPASTATPEAIERRLPMEAVAAWLVPFWIAGAAIGLLILIVGLLHLTWLASKARRVDGGRWAAIAIETAAAVGLQRGVTILQSDHPSLLVTWGLWRPKVILPAASGQWSDDRVRVVLRHEFAHIGRGDWAVFMAAELLRTIYWFNPLVWIACNRVRQDSENACDDAVLDAGIAGSDYATHLLELARTLNASRRTPPLPAPAMARPSSLQGRISAMLNASLNRRPLTPSVRVASFAAFLALTVLLAGVGAQRFYTLSGSVLDSTNRNLPDVRVVVTNTASRAKHEVRSDRTGHFEFVGLPPGEYALEASLPGFAIVKDTVNIIGKDIEQRIDMQIGSLEETLTITSAVADAPAAQTTDAERLRQELNKVHARVSAEERQRAALERCAAGILGPTGGQILAPLKLTNVNPKYPESMRTTRTGGVVTLDAVIGTDGNIQEVRAVSSPHPDLEAAAIEAVRQWQFTPTLLNCVPTEVPMKVTLRFNSVP